jgi:divalent metal cation (Fe/Co/Zn/Cd) transporter
MLYLLNDGPLAQGWWIIPVLFGLVIPAWLIYNGYQKAQRGTYQTVDDPTPANPKRVKRIYDKTPQPWYKHSLSIMGLVLFFLIVVLTVLRIMYFE